MNRKVLYFLTILYVLVVSVSTLLLQILDEHPTRSQMQWFTSFFDRFSTWSHLATVSYDVSE